MFLSFIPAGVSVPTPILQTRATRRTGLTRTHRAGIDLHWARRDQSHLGHTKRRFATRLALARQFRCLATQRFPVPWHAPAVEAHRGRWAAYCRSERGRGM